MDFADFEAFHQLHQRMAHRDMPDCGMSQNLHQSSAHTDMDGKAMMAEKLQTMRTIAEQKNSKESSDRLLTTSSYQHQYTAAWDMAERMMMPMEPEIQAATTVTSQLIMGDEEEAAAAAAAAAAAGAGAGVLEIASPTAMDSQSPCSFEHKILAMPNFPTTQQLLSSSLLPSSLSQPLLHATSDPSASPHVPPMATLLPPPSPTLPHHRPLPQEGIDINTFSLVGSPMQELKQIEAFLLGALPSQQGNAYGLFNICSSSQSEMEQMPLDSAAAVNRTHRFVCTDFTDASTCPPVADVAADADFPNFAGALSAGALCAGAVSGSADTRDADAVSNGGLRCLEAVCHGGADPCCNADIVLSSAGPDVVAAAAASAVDALAPMAADTARDALAALVADTTALSRLIEAEMRRIDDTLLQLAHMPKLATEFSAEISPESSLASALEGQTSLELTRGLLPWSSLHPASTVQSPHLASTGQSPHLASTGQSPLPASTVHSAAPIFTSRPAALLSGTSSWFQPPLAPATAASAAVAGAALATVFSTPAATAVLYPLSCISLPKMRPAEADRLKPDELFEARCNGSICRVSYQ
ncbi:hypothetical protein CLOM_g4367 [Closterium sp. NIES-68]|nr:hypothetical protein CLOM_g4367 [Closterium sp. NIES-68]GJP86923.1 hypothetical protein CLOP_g16889 [Closterium sp. NIES-67]